MQLVVNEAVTKDMARGWSTQTKITLVADTEQVVALNKEVSFLRIDSAVDLKIEFDLDSGSTSITDNTPVFVLGGLPEAVHVANGLRTKNSDILYVHFESASSGDLKWATR